MSPKCYDSAWVSSQDIIPSFMFIDATAHYVSH